MTQKNNLKKIYFSNIIFKRMFLKKVLASDDEMLSLELGTLCKKYPDVSHEQILCLLIFRGDLPKAEAKALTAEFVPEGGPAKTLHARSILSQVTCVQGEL